MEFGILGLLEVRRDGDTLALGGVKQRSLLAILLLHANEVVGSERLIDEVAQPPGTAATALHGYVSQLRKALEPGGAPYSVLVTHPPGYVLHVERTASTSPGSRVSSPAPKQQSPSRPQRSCARRSRSGAGLPSPISPTRCSAA